MKVYILETVKFNFKSTKTILLVIRFYLVTVIAFFLVISAPKNIVKSLPDYLFIGVFMVIFIMIYFMLRPITIIRIFIEFKDFDTIVIRSRYILFREFITIIPYSEIENYLFEVANGYNVFSIKYNDKRIKLLINTETKNLNSFNEFLLEFNKKIERYNKFQNHDKIKKQSTIYERPIGLVYACVIVILLCLIPIFNFAFGIKVNIPLLLILYPSGLFYLYKFYLGRKK